MYLVRTWCIQCIPGIQCSTLQRPGVALLPLLPLLCRDPESPGTAPTLAAYCAGALHAALLYASVTINCYA